MSHSEFKSGDIIPTKRAYSARASAPDCEMERLQRKIERVRAEFSDFVCRSAAERESERQSIARELHDNFGQFLSVLDMELGAISRTGDAAIKERVEKLRRLSADALDDVSRLAWEIRPPALDDQGLQSASERFLAEWRDRSTLKFDLHLTLGDRKLRKPVETTLYRILQEAIRNIVKHADATKVGIILQATASEVRLVVEDNGNGFNERQTSGDHAAIGLGLLGIRERLALIGGTFEIETAPGRGTALFVRVPL